MTLNPMGRINVPTPGTPVQISTNTALRVTKLFFQAVPGLTGKTYIGKSGMNKTTFAGVARVLAPNSTGIADQFLIEADDAENATSLIDYFVDADVAGEGLLVTYWTE